MAILGQLASSVGHELRNPLAVISNALYLLDTSMHDPDERTRNYIQMIRQETSRSDKIISDLLTFTRIRPGSRQPVDMEELVEKALRRYEAPPLIIVKTSMADDLQPAYVDEGQIEQVLGNLITNAYQAMQKGGTLTIAGEDCGEELLISVSDTGVGIRPENLMRIWEPLYTTKAKGIGLGLTVTKLLTEANGGRVQVKSKAGKGTTFSLRLPKKGGDSVGIE